MREGIHLGAGAKEERLEKFMEVLKQDPLWYNFFNTELTTGMRRGEICGLKWQKTGRLYIHRSVGTRKGGGVNEKRELLFLTVPSFRYGSADAIGKSR